MPTIKWNNNVKLILADVDETIADVYTDATPSMVQKLNYLLKKEVTLFLVTGTGIERVKNGIVNKLQPELRHRILVAHCSGAEIFGFDKTGNIMDPYYSVYDQKMTDPQKLVWRGIVDQIIGEFKLETTPTMTVAQFKEQAGDNPFVIMKADRGPQITLEFVNSYDLTADQLAQIEKTLDINVQQSDGKFDLRTNIYNRSEELFVAANLPVHPHLAGVFALDFILEGVSKTTAITTILNDHTLLNKYGLPLDIARQPERVEIWGDKFGIVGGSDRKMSMSVHPRARSIDFRDESSVDLGNESNIVLWDGERKLHLGLDEYLESIS